MRELRHGPASGWPRVPQYGRRPWIATATALAMTATALGCGGEMATTIIATTSQESGSDGNDGDTALIVVGAVLLVTTAAGLVVFTVAEDVGYLELHQQDIRRALARGDGAFVSDLGQALALPPRLLPRLQAVLKDARGALDRPLAGIKLDTARAQLFGGELVRVLKADPELAPYLRGLVSKYGPLLARR